MDSPPLESPSAAGPVFTPRSERTGVVAAAVPSGERAATRRYLDSEIHTIFRENGRRTVGMAITVETQDCTQLTGSDLKEMIEVCAGTPFALDSEAMSHQVESWVLLTQARENGKLRGFSFCTLERIGGTPCVLQGSAHVSRTSRRSTVVRAMVADQMRRAALSFPDEDVLFGARINDPGAFEAYSRFHDVMPRPERKAKGEDRAWGKRLAKRFGVSFMRYEDRKFITRTKQWPPTVYDHVSLKSDYYTTGMETLLDSLVASDGDTLIVHGWVMSEELEKLL